MEFNITEEDVNAGRLLEPAWYPFEISKIEEKPAKKGDGSKVAHVSLVSFGDIPGVEVMTFFSTKAPRMAIPFFKAVGAGEGAGTYVFDDSLVGAKLELKIANEMYNDRMQNKVVDFRPLSK